MSEATPPVVIGVGLDTARYGHHASFLRDDLQPAAKPLRFEESRAGYDRFLAVLGRLAQRQGDVHFHIRLDAAGQYSDNLQAFLQQLDFPKTVSIGDPQRNKNYKNTHFPKRKADPVDSLACARFAIRERPAASLPTPVEFTQLRDVASALAGQRKQTTRCINRLHNQLARVFPELALLASNLDAGWVLTLLKKYPTARRIAAARRGSLTAIPHINAELAEKLQAAARSSTATLDGPVAEALVQQLVADLTLSRQAETRLEQLLEQSFDALPDGGHRQLLTILGIGKRTAAALVAKIVSIDRFPTPAALVSYFGAFPEEDTSGVDKQGRPLVRGAQRMSRKGNDLVRGWLWMACQSAVQHNPAIRALYHRQRAAGKRGDVALGHCMRKMLHLVFAVWKSDKPFDPRHYAWEPRVPSEPAVDEPGKATAQEDAAGRTEQGSERQAVTAAVTQLATRSVPPTQTTAKQETGAGESSRSTTSGGIDFAVLRRQVTMADVLNQLGILERMQGSGPQRRGPCPVHEPDANTGRCFSVNLAKHVFRCLHPDCAAQGNVLDLWGAVHKLPLYEAAWQMQTTFHLDHNSPQTRPQKPPEPQS